MNLDEIYANVPSRVIPDSTGPQTQNRNQDEEKGQKQSRCRWSVLVLTMSLGIICVVLLVFITLQHISITAKRDLFENTVEELNHTISNLQHNNTDLKTEKQQLENNFSSLNQEKQNLETRVNNLGAEKKQLQIRSDSLNEENQKLKTSVSSLSNDLNKMSSKRLFFPPSRELKSWSESRQYCRDRGADLVMIKSEEKQNYIFSLVKESVWIGMSDIESEGNMKWVDNSHLNQRFWQPNEPNNYGEEDCVELNPGQSVLSSWNDISCSSVRQFICEN